MRRMISLRISASILSTKSMRSSADNSSGDPPLGSRRTLVRSVPSVSRTTTSGERWAQFLADRFGCNRAAGLDPRPYTYAATLKRAPTISAICTAFRAAPLRRLSLLTNSTRPLFSGADWSARIRPT